MYTGMSVISTPDIKRHQGEEHSISLVEGREKPGGGEFTLCNCTSQHQLFT